MGTIKKKTITYLQLFRLQTAAVTATTPLIGGLLMNQRDPLLLTMLFAVGILYHIFGFVLNEYVDIEVDKKSDDLKKKPLVSGAITKNTALPIVMVSMIGACVLLIFFFQSVFPILFFIVALFLGLLYDVYGKRMPGSDFVLAGGFFFLCLTGASTSSLAFPTMVYLVCLLYFFQIVFNNAVEGGLKDVDHDALGGAKTLATRMGVYIHNGTLQTTKTFSAFAYSVRIIFFGLIVVLGLQQELAFWEGNIFLRLTAVLFGLVMFATLHLFMCPLPFDRGRLKRLFSIHEMTSYFLVLVVLSPLLGLWLTLILIFIPTCWYIALNIALYGKLLQPQV